MVIAEAFSWSWLAGLKLRFNVCGHELEVRCSRLTGKEQIFLDGELIASGRNRRQYSLYMLSIDNHSYTVELNKVSKRSGHIECLLVRDDQVQQGFIVNRQSAKPVRIRQAGVGLVGLTGFLGLQSSGLMTPVSIALLGLVLVVGFSIFSGRGWDGESVDGGAYSSRD